MTQWKISDAIKIINGDIPTQTTLKINQNAYNISETAFTFYYSYLQTMYGEIVTFNEYYIMIAPVLQWNNTSSSTKVEILADKDSEGYYCMCYSSDGKNWIYSGTSFCLSTDPSKNVFQGASTAKLILREGTKNTVDFIYSVQDNGDGGQDVGRVMYRQSGTLSISGGVPTLSGFPTNISSNNGRPLLTTLFMAPDDINYSSYNSNQNCYFENPNFYVIEDTMYCIFNASVAYGNGSIIIDSGVKGNPMLGFVPETNTNQYCGCIGIASIPAATFKTGSYTSSDWTMYPPLITTLGVTNRPYMPSIVIEDDKVYLFFNSEGNSVIPSGLYGFISYTGITGEYYPLNGSGCVLKNPSSSPNQNSSWTVDSSFAARSINLELVDDNDNITIIGSPSPVYEIVVSGDSTYTGKIKNYGLSNLREWSSIYTNSNNG